MAHQKTKTPVWLLIAVILVVGLMLSVLFENRSTTTAPDSNTQAYNSAAINYLQNAVLELQGNQQALGASLQVPNVKAFFETSLASKISSSATSFTLTSAADKEGVTLASSTYAFVIDEGTASEEMVIADCTGTACTNATRGVSVTSGTTSVSALQHSHGRGASVKITDGPILLILNRLAQGIDTFPNLLAYTSGTACTAGSAGGTICDKTYLDSVAGAGAATSTESTGGLVELGTALEAASSTYLGVNQPTVMQTKNATDTPQSGCASGYTAAGAGCSVVAQLTGYIRQSWLNLTQHFNFSSIFATNASSTNATTTSLYVTGLASKLLKVDANGQVVGATANVDYGLGGSYSFATTTSSAGANNDYASSTANLTIPASTLTASSSIHFRINFSCIDGGSGSAQTCTARFKTSNGESLLACSVTITSAQTSNYSFYGDIVATSSVSSWDGVGAVSEVSLPRTNDTGGYCTTYSTHNFTSSTGFAFDIKGNAAQTKATILSYTITVNP